ncbi:hypothetical protein [Halorarum salinum]|uniref:Uncharacterized protein n=1 Tax=Halorarum salinum TaxID=2743089 RepID=A0A7D5L9T8_9EURY|nr:hypothetical protein [Halobaculum salinum]QLG61472.1 hypothetical protein HUG12_06875 [Halobaculum salinum]
MGEVATANVYGLFFLAASAAVVLLALSAYVLGRRIGHERALVGVLGLVGAFTVVGGVGGLGAEAARVPVLLGAAFLYVPLAVGAAVAKGLTAHGWREVCRVLIGGWMAALVFALVTQAAGASLEAAVSWGPTLFGVDWYGGFLAYMLVVGVLAGGATAALLSRSPRETSVSPA